MDDVVLVRKAAADYVRQMGPKAVCYLEEQATISAGIGDADAERAWRDIARAAKQILM